MRRLTFCLWTLTIFILFSSRGFTTSFAIHQLTANEGNKNSPTVYNGTIAWSGESVKDQIYYWVGNTTILQVSDRTISWANRYPSLYNGTIAWQGKSSTQAGGDFEIYYWDGKTIIQVTNNDVDDQYPSLYNGMITWHGWDGNDWEIYYWDGNTITQLTRNSERDAFPSLYNRTISWEGGDGNDLEIFYWDGSTVVQITNNSVDDGASSLYDGTIAWQEPAGIFYWNGNNITRIGSGHSPSLYNGTIAFAGEGGEASYWNGHTIIQFMHDRVTDGPPSLHRNMVAWTKQIGSTRDSFYTEIFYAILEADDTYQVETELGKGINLLSLPLQPEKPLTASQLAADINATWVIRAIDGRFQTYIPEGNFGIDFDIEVSQGYIVNLLEAKTYSVTGQPWGTPVSAAPTPSVNGTWAFVVAGKVDGVVPTEVDGIRIVNSHTGERLLVPISPSGKFTAAFVDMSKQSVVAVGNEITTQLIGVDGVPLSKPKRHLISPQQISHAYLLTQLSAVPEKTQLLQNYPNPFNPETWLPFQLASPADVTIAIYDIRGKLIRQLNFGHQPAGLYLSRERAGYWDGRSETGELVSSGLYFYQLRAGSYSASKRMAILK